MQVFDVAVIGFGKAGKTIAMKRAQTGDRVVLFERSPKMYGGTCINIGCVPTKTLITAVDASVSAYRTLGLEVDGPRAWKQAQERRNTLIERMNNANLGMVRAAGVTVVDGSARFTGPDTIECGGETFQAGTIIINTGAEAAKLPLPGADGPLVHDSTSIQFLPTLPKRLTIVGAGPIALEFAGIFNRLGVTVTILDAAPRFLGRFDRDVAEAVLEDLRERGVDYRGGVQVREFVQLGEDPATASVKVLFTSEDGEQSQEADAVLVAVGRRPASAELNLQAAGVAVDERGAITVDAHLRTNVDGIYAVGDVNGGPQFTYISFDDHRVVMADRWGVPMGEHSDTRGRVIPNTTFIDPPLSSIGATEAELVEAGVDYRVSAAKIADIAVMPRPKIVGNPAGMAKFLLGEDGQILGATLWCVDSQELINTVAVAMAHGVSSAELGRMIVTHPASSEVFNGLL